MEYILKKLILFICLFFFQPLLPSDFGLQHASRLSKALFATAGTAAAVVGLGAYHLNKKGEERYKSAYKKRFLVGTPPEISTGWRVARNLLTVLSSADTVVQDNTHSRLSSIKLVRYVIQKTGLDQIINKDMSMENTPITPIDVTPSTQTHPLETKDIQTLCIGWEPHQELLELFYNTYISSHDPFSKQSDFSSINRLKKLIDGLEEMNPSFCPRQYLLEYALRRPDTTAYSTILIDSNLFAPYTHITLIICGKKLYKFTQKSKNIPMSKSEEELFPQKLLKTDILIEIYQHLKAQAPKILCLMNYRNYTENSSIFVAPELIAEITGYL